MLDAKMWDTRCCPCLKSTEHTCASTHKHKGTSIYRVCHHRPRPLYLGVCHFVFLYFLLSFSTHFNEEEKKRERKGVIQQFVYNPVSDLPSMAYPLPLLSRCSMFSSVDLATPNLLVRTFLWWCKGITCCPRVGRCGLKKKNLMQIFFIYR